jgi:dTMP kinase
MTKLPKEQWPGFLNWLSDLEYNKMGLPRPQKTIYLDMPPEVSQKMLSARYHGDESKKDIHESHVEFLKKCRETALYAGESWQWARIDCADGEWPRSIGSIAEQVTREAMEVLKP